MRTWCACVCVIRQFMQLDYLHWKCHMAVELFTLSKSCSHTLTHTYTHLQLIMCSKRYSGSIMFYTCTPYSRSISRPLLFALIIFITMNIRHSLTLWRLCVFSHLKKKKSYFQFSTKEHSVPREAKTHRRTAILINIYLYIYIFPIWTACFLFVLISAFGLY